MTHLDKAKAAYEAAFAALSWASTAEEILTAYTEAQNLAGWQACDLTHFMFPGRFERPWEPNVKADLFQARNHASTMRRMVDEIEAKVRVSGAVED